MKSVTVRSERGYIVLNSYMHSNSVPISPNVVMLLRLSIASLTAISVIIAYVQAGNWIEAETTKSPLCEAFPDASAEQKVLSGRIS